MTFEVHNAGTVYRVHRHDFFDIDAHVGRRFWLVESGWGSNYGEWIETGTASISWNYLAEKMPIMGKRAGDKPGWIMAFAKAGLEVFG